MTVPHAIFLHPPPPYIHQFPCSICTGKWLLLDIISTKLRGRGCCGRIVLTFRFAVEVQRSPTLTPALLTMPLCKQLLSRWQCRRTWAHLTPSNSSTISLTLSDHTNPLTHWTQQRRAHWKKHSTFRYLTLHSTPSNQDATSIIRPL